jgi:hypothetical protein
MALSMDFWRSGLEKLWIWKTGGAAERDGSVQKDRPIRDLLHELNRRAKEGFKHAPFKMTFWVGVVLCGGLGVWYEIYKILTELINGHDTQDSKLLQPLRTAFATFFPAIIGTVSLQMVFEDENKSHRGAAVCVALLFLILLVPTVDSNWHDGFGVLLGAGLSCASLWIWCAANGLSASFRQSLDAPVGDKPLDGELSGSDDLADIAH